MFLFIYIMIVISCLLLTFVGRRIFVLCYSTVDSEASDRKYSVAFRELFQNFSFQIPLYDYSNIFTYSKNNTCFSDYKFTMCSIYKI